MPQRTQRVEVPYQEGRAEKMRDPTPLPPASAIHRVGMSLLEKNVLSLSSGGAGVLLRGEAAIRHGAPQLCLRKLPYLEQSMENSILWASYKPKEI